MLNRTIQPLPGTSKYKRNPQLNQFNTVCLTDVINSPSSHDSSHQPLIPTTQIAANQRLNHSTLVQNPLSVLPKVLNQTQLKQGYKHQYYQNLSQSMNTSVLQDYAESTLNQSQSNKQAINPHQSVYLNGLKQQQIAQLSINNSKSSERSQDQDEKGTQINMEDINQDTVYLEETIIGEDNLGEKEKQQESQSLFRDMYIKKQSNKSPGQRKSIGGKRVKLPNSKFKQSFEHKKIDISIKKGQVTIRNSRNDSKKGLKHYTSTTINSQDDRSPQITSRQRQSEVLKQSTFLPSINNDLQPILNGQEVKNRQRNNVGKKFETITPSQYSQLVNTTGCRKSQVKKGVNNAILYKLESQPQLPEASITSPFNNQKKSSMMIEDQVRQELHNEFTEYVKNQTAALVKQKKDQFAQFERSEDNPNLQTLENSLTTKGSKENLIGDNHKSNLKAKISLKKNENGRYNVFQKLYKKDVQKRNDLKEVTKNKVKQQQQKFVDQDYIFRLSQMQGNMSMMEHEIGRGDKNQSEKLSIVQIKGLDPELDIIQQKMQQQFQQNQLILQQKLQKQIELNNRHLQLNGTIQNQQNFPLELLDLSKLNKSTLSPVSPANIEMLSKNITQHQQATNNLLLQQLKSNSGEWNPIQQNSKNILENKVGAQSYNAPIDLSFKQKQEVIQDLTSNENRFRNQQYLRAMNNNTQLYHSTQEKNGLQQKIMMDSGSQYNLMNSRYNEKQAQASSSQMSSYRRGNQGIMKELYQKINYRPQDQQQANQTAMSHQKHFFKMSQESVRNPQFGVTKHQQLSRHNSQLSQQQQKFAVNIPQPQLQHKQGSLLASAVNHQVSSLDSQGSMPSQVQKTEKGKILLYQSQYNSGQQQQSNKTSSKPEFFITNSRLQSQESKNTTANFQDKFLNIKEDGSTHRDRTSQKTGINYGSQKTSMVSQATGFRPKQIVGGSKSQLSYYQNKRNANRSNFQSQQNPASLMVTKSNMNSEKYLQLLNRQSLNQGPLLKNDLVSSAKKKQISVKKSPVKQNSPSKSLIPPTAQFRQSQDKFPPVILHQEVDSEAYSRKITKNTDQVLISLNSLGDQYQQLQQSEVMFGGLGGNPENSESKRQYQTLNTDQSQTFRNTNLIGSQGSNQILRSKYNPQAKVTIDKVVGYKDYILEKSIDDRQNTLSILQMRKDQSEATNFGIAQQNEDSSSPQQHQQILLDHYQYFLPNDQQCNQNLHLSQYQQDPVQKSVRKRKTFKNFQFYKQKIQKEEQNKNQLEENKDIIRQRRYKVLVNQCQKNQNTIQKAYDIKIEDSKCKSLYHDSLAIHHIKSMRGINTLTNMHQINQSTNQLSQGSITF